MRKGGGLLIKSRKLELFAWLLLATLGSSTLEASKPKCEKSLEEVSAVIGQTFGPSLDYSTSALIPLSQLIASIKDPYIIWLHMNGQIHQKEFPTPGLAQMYRTASTAADALLEHLEEKAVRPEYRTGDLFSAAAETEELMLNPKKQPLYIRDAVLIRDGVVMVIPILQRMKKGKKPVYMPIVAKGHQDLRQEDKLAAAFAAWALGRSLGSIPSQAKIFLKPMIDPRTPAKKNARKHTHYEEFIINVEDHLPEVEGIHADYMNLMSNPEALAKLQARRTPQLMKNPFGVYTREKLHEKRDLSMMPFPPSKEQVKDLRAAGYGDLDKLSTLDVNSPQFFEVAIISGIAPERLRRYVAHAVAAKNDSPVILKEFVDPFEDARYIVHVDFEDMMNREYRSGVYLFGARLEDPQSRKKDKIVDELFRFSDKLTQTSMEEAWADFLRFFKKNAKLKGGDYKVSVYSHHEFTKFMQEFDMLKAKPGTLTPSQRRSPYFWAHGDHEYLIRNQAFFKRFKDLRPQDVFNILERIVDLYPYVRGNFAFPTYSNGLKHILDYVIRSQDLKLDYPEGWNGLESIEWAIKAYQTGRKELFDQIERYNRIDVDGNLVVVRYIREQAEVAADADFDWSDQSFELLKDVSRATTTRAQVESLLQRHELLTKIIGKPLSALTDAQIAELEKVLDRADYLEARDRIVESDKISEEEKEQLLQRLTHQFKDERKAALLATFSKISGKAKKNITDGQVDSITDLFLIHRVDAYTSTTIHKMVLLDRLLGPAKKQFARPAQDLYRRMKLPDAWLEYLKSLREQEILEGLALKSQDLRALWIGLYYYQAFQVDEAQ